MPLNSGIYILSFVAVSIIIIGIIMTTIGYRNKTLDVSTTRFLFLVFIIFIIAFISVMIDVFNGDLPIITV